MCSKVSFCCINSHAFFFVDGRIWTGCDYICSAYDDGQDVAFYMCHDRIASLASVSLTGGDSIDAVLGCQVLYTLRQAVGTRVKVMQPRDCLAAIALPALGCK